MHPTQRIYPLSQPIPRRVASRQEPKNLSPGVLASQRTTSSVVPLGPVRAGHRPVLLGGEEGEEGNAAY